MTNLHRNESKEKWWKKKYKGVKLIDIHSVGIVTEKETHFNQSFYRDLINDRRCQWLGYQY